MPRVQHAKGDAWRRWWGGGMQHCIEPIEELTVVVEESIGVVSPPTTAEETPVT